MFEITNSILCTEWSNYLFVEANNMVVDRNRQMWTLGTSLGIWWEFRGNCLGIVWNFLSLIINYLI
jgi:hypothetical protein